MWLAKPSLQDFCIPTILPVLIGASQEETPLLLQKTHFLHCIKND
jgi:hypothetical protein